MLDAFMGAPLSGAGWPGVLTPGQLAAHNQEIDSFYKALVAAGGSDVATLTGGSALRKESIEAALIVATVRPDHFVFWNKVSKTPATALLHEYGKQTDIGGIPMSSAVGEQSTIPENTGAYSRGTTRIKLLKDRRVVTLEGEMQAANGLASAIARETNSGALKLTTDAEAMSFFGDESCNAFEFNGLVKVLSDLGGDHVIDMRGQPLSANVRELNNGARLIWDQGNWGLATDFLCSGLCQADIDANLSPTYRIDLTQGPNKIELGAPVFKIKTRFGLIDCTPDVFIQESGAPYVARGGNYAAQLAASGTTVPASIAGVGGANAASKFLAAHGGLYYYGVQATRPEGDSALVLSAQVNVAAGNRVVVTITPQAGNNATAYRVFRGRKNGTNAPADLREMARIPANGDNAVVYNDDNQNIPGTSYGFLLTMKEDALVMKRFAGMLRFPLSATVSTIYTWAQVLDVALQVSLERQHVLVKNILPTGAQAVWDPFN
ncbi:MAG: hypothetical protein ABI629_10395 [bacterium]